MNEVKRYHVGDSGLVEGASLGRINVVLGADYDQLTSKVGNMVCAKRQMDEELEIARDDLVIFKGALSALGEASKKLVVCARTSGGTAGPDQGLMDACAGVEGVITLAGVARAINDFERVTAERDALQLRLTTTDQRVDDLETHLDGAQDQLGAAWDVLHAAGIVSPGTLSVAEGIAMLLQTKLKAAVNQTAESCQFPQSCTTRCDCDIPDFSPGNGNKARRRAETIHGFKIVEDPTLAPGEMKLVQPTAKADDSFSTCLGCFGAGTVSTGIEEASSTICNGCDGTGRERS